MNHKMVLFLALFLATEIKSFSDEQEDGYTCSMEVEDGCLYLTTKSNEEEEEEEGSVTITFNPNNNSLNATYEQLSCLGICKENINITKDLNSQSFTQPIKIYDRAKNGATHYSTAPTTSNLTPVDNSIVNILKNLINSIESATIYSEDSKPKKLNILDKEKSIKMAVNYNNDINKIIGTCYVWDSSNGLNFAIHLTKDLGPKPVTEVIKNGIRTLGNIYYIDQLKEFMSEY